MYKMSKARPRLSRIHHLLAGRPRTLATFIATLAIAMFLSVGALAWFAYDVTAGLPDRGELAGLGDMAQSTTILDAGDRVVFTIFKEQRIEIPLDRMSKNLIDAVISVEDQRFYDHSGVDAVRVAAAALRNVRAGRRAEGGSTITQQLARQGFLTRDKTYQRKLREVVLATYIESAHSKDEILELYLNKVYFGDGLYGVEAASRGYFDKPASELNVEEAALLAGLIQSPSSYAPTVNKDRAVARRNVVLQTMVSSGAIDADTAERARNAEVELKNGMDADEPFGLYFKEHVRRELVDRFGWERVYQGGLRVFTTMDSDLQQAAEALVEESLVDIERRRGFSHDPRAKHPPLEEGEAPAYLQAALVSLDPATGHVRAMVGGRDFKESRFNRATQARRQSGSAFKPFVFAAALEAGQSPATLITRLNDPTLTPDGAWLPEDGHTTASSMTMRAALRTSSNRAAVQLLHSVGIQKAVDYAEKLNVGAQPPVPSMALGVGEVSLMALTAAYGAFADAGKIHPPVLIRKVEASDGEVLFEDEGKSEEVVSETTAFLMSSMLADVVNAGTGYRVRQAGFTAPAAGKTGTTNDYFDVWFVGFTPKVVTGVWLGFDQPQTIIRDGYAGEIAVPMWANFMKVATKGHKPDWFTRPSNVVGVNVCRLSGQLPNDGCGHIETISNDGSIEQRSMIYTEYFARGTQPRSACSLHPSPVRIHAVVAAGDPAAGVEAGLPGGISGTAGVTAPAAPAARPSDATAKPATGKEAPEEPRRRGFWGRLFGRGGDDEARRQQEEQEKLEEQKKKQQEQKKKPGGGGLP
ncbi:penicillin-binding protein 1A [soil metagenome]